MSQCGGSVIQLGSAGQEAEGVRQATWVEKVDAHSRKATGNVPTYTGLEAIWCLHRLHHGLSLTGAISRILGRGGTLSVDSVKTWGAIFQRTIFLGRIRESSHGRRLCCYFLRHRKNGAQMFQLIHSRHVREKRALGPLYV